MNQRKTVQSFVLAAAVVAIGLPLSASAAAPSHLEDVSIKVSYHDLNLDNEVGVQTLYSRLKRASRKACNVRSRTVVGSLRELAEIRLCYSNTLEAAVEKLDNDTLTRIHNG